MEQTKIEPDVLTSWRLMLTVHARLVDVLASEMDQETGLPLAWYEVLLYLAEAGEGQLRMHELAEKRLLSRSAATRLIDRIEAAGYVSRFTCAEDRRGMWVKLTDAGREAFTRAGRVHLAGIARHYGRHVDPDDAATMNAVFRRILARFED